MAGTHTARLGMDRQTSLFDIDWQNPGNNQLMVRHASRQVAVQNTLPKQITNLFRWKRKRTRDRATEDTGARFKELTEMSLDVGANPEEWQPVQALGRGGFGAVVMFQKSDARNHVTDEIAVKTTEVKHRHANTVVGSCLSDEAAIMAQTNKASHDGLLALRAFKTVYRNLISWNPDIGLPEQWRYYFEFCEHGDLERLRVKYKAYGRYLPETFLWHLFYWLAMGLDACATGVDNNGVPQRSFRDDRTAKDWGKRRNGAYLLHNDIKPHNIFLGDISGVQPDAYYPIPRIGDFGLAMLTERMNPDNEAHRLTSGTEQYFPPEQRADNIDKNTPFYPFGRRVAADPRDPKRHHHITSAANVFAIGMVMFQMLTLHESSFLERRIEWILTENSGRVKANNPWGYDINVVDSDDFKDMRKNGLEDPYSDELEQLIISCLLLKPEERIAESVLKTKTLYGYKQNIQLLPGRGTPQAKVNQFARVHYARNEIHNSALNPNEGKHRFPERAGYQWWSHHFWQPMMWYRDQWGYDRPEHMPSTQEFSANDMLPNWPSDMAKAILASSPDSDATGETDPVYNPVPYRRPRLGPLLPRAPEIPIADSDETRTSTHVPFEVPQRQAGRPTGRYGLIGAGGGGIGPVRTDRPNVRFDPLAGRHPGPRRGGYGNQWLQRN